MIHGYWVDENNNKWDAVYYTKEEAEKYSKTLVNCRDCENCEDCINCVGCRDCIRCANCIGREDCIDYDEDGCQIDIH